MEEMHGVGGLIYICDVLFHKLNSGEESPGIIYLASCSSSVRKQQCKNYIPRVFSANLGTSISVHGLFSLCCA